jgi:hypothetical protein
MFSNMRHAVMTVTALRALAGVLVVVMFVMLPLPASAGTLTGTVMHVSTTNMEVKDRSGKVYRFVLVPEFNRIFSKDGKTTVQMTDLKPGTPVTVTYTDTLGILHPNKIQKR